MPKVTLKDILKKKSRGKITMLTCYDFSFAQILDATGIDIILVGDSLANVILGMEATRKVSITEMLNHTQAVAKAVKRSLVVADMPYASYQKDPKKALYYAKKFIRAGADAVKVEWFNTGRKNSCPKVVASLIKNKIPVMGHIGLTPQTVHLLGGYKVQGKDKESALNLIQQAKILEDLGIFCLVLECIPRQLSRIITEKSKMPTIGIGAGKDCDGQVLVLYDLLGIYSRVRPRFVKIYKNLGKQTKIATQAFIEDVKKSRFPSQNESFSLKPDTWQSLKKSLKIS